MSRNDHSTLHLETLFTVLQAVLALLLSNRNQVTEGATITVSPSSLGLHSLTIQRNITTSSASLYEPKTTTLTTNVVSSVNFTSSASPAVKTSILFSRYTKTVSSTVTTAFPTTRISVTQSNYTTTPTVPTTVLIVKGLPDGSVIAVMAGILGAILLILFGIIVWHLCIAQTLERRPSSRVQPSEVSGSVSELL